MLIKKTTSYILTIVMILVMSISAVYASEDKAKDEKSKNKIEISAKSGVLIDAKSGQIIYEKNMHEKLAPASITKIMVMVLAMEDIESGKITLKDEVKVSKAAADMGGSQLFLHEGETQTVEDLLKSISIRSANDSAVALGEYLEESLDTFIDRMNNRAMEIGMKNTHFKNTTGLPAEGHYSTAYDISLMSKELLKHPKTNEWLTTWMTDIKVGKNKDINQSLVNTNKLVRFYEGANGIKTGFTNDAGFCLSASAKREKLSLISVTLGSETSDIRFDEAKKLLDYGFSKYESVTVRKKNDVIKNLQISKGDYKSVDLILKEDIDILVEKGIDHKIDREIKLPDKIKAPFRKNQVVGELIVKVDGVEVAKEKIICSKEIKKASVMNLFDRGFRSIIEN